MVLGCVWAHIWAAGCGGWELGWVAGVGSLVVEWEDGQAAWGCAALVLAVLVLVMVLLLALVLVLKQVLHLTLVSAPANWAPAH